MAGRGTTAGDRIVGLELLGAQNYIQQIFYGAALFVAVLTSPPKGAGPGGRQ
jgi:hypothetical protein